MSTSGNSLEVRQALRRMRRLALAFHGSELRLRDRREQSTNVVRANKARTVRDKARVGA
jgi:hypothetical protein